MGVDLAEQLAFAEAHAAAGDKADPEEERPVASTAVVEELITSIETLQLDNFDPYDATKRPEGWVEARQRRIDIQERIDRDKAVEEAFIEKMRMVREQEVGST